MTPFINKPVGNMIRLKCFADGNPLPNVTWTKDGKEISRRYGTVQYSRWSISFEDAVVDDSGNYTCIVCNEEGCIHYTFTIDIIGKY